MIWPKLRGLSLRLQQRMKICGVLMHRQPLADSNRPNFQDLHDWRQCQLQSGLLSPDVKTCYITTDIAEGNTISKFYHVSVLVQSELSERQCRLTPGLDVVFEIFVFFPILCMTNLEHATVSCLKHYGRFSVISLFSFLCHVE